MPLDEGEEQYGDYAEVVDPPVPDEPPGEMPGQQYLPFDLTVVRPFAFDPPKKEYPDTGHLLDDDGEKLPIFDEQYIDDFNGLAFIGALSKQFQWLGHTFVIRTLTTDELLAVAVVTERYKNTIAEPMAYKTAMVALATAKVDGQELPTPVESGEDQAWAFQRFNYVKARWFQFTVDAVYEQYLELEQKTAQVVAAMGKAFSPTG